MAQIVGIDLVHIKMDDGCDAREVALPQDRLGGEENVECPFLKFFESSFADFGFFVSRDVLSGKALEACGGIQGVECFPAPHKDESG